MTGPRNALLGAFLRAHRQRLKPSLAAGRRRTPGLRREELAGRAGISTTWYTWLEQGRDVKASPQALARLAVGLQLTAAEREYLFALAGARDPNLPAAGAEDGTPPSVSAAIGALRHPAYGLDRLWNAAAWNRAAARLLPDWLGPGAPERNLLRFVFLDPAARALIPRWPERAARLLAEFRADFSRGIADPQMQALVADLREASPAFRSGWDEQAVQARGGGLRVAFRTGTGRQSHYLQHTFRPAERPDWKLVLLVPA